MPGRKQKRSCISLAAALFPLAAIAGTCEIRSGPARVHLIELYTSEGCNSCPPAEHWMSAIRDKENLIGLEFHVDYWDSPAWHDPYAKQVWARRQETKAQQAKAQVYTPQIWLDGKLWKNWPRGEAPGAAQPVSAQASTALHMRVDTGDDLTVRVQTNASEAGERKRLYIALTENHLVQQISGGENKGRRLEHDQVVRDLVGPLRLPEAQAELKIPASMALPNAAIIAFVQDESGATEQALRLPLSECKQ